jgi:D-arabinose 1-dehydrogenase-like Zn-dependent alcohol dehydrogenase
LAGVHPMIETFPLERAAEAYERMASGKVRFRAVLTI